MGNDVIRNKEYILFKYLKNEMYPIENSQGIVGIWYKFLDTFGPVFIELKMSENVFRNIAF